MTFEEYFERVRADYAPVRALSKKEGNEAYLLRHKTLGKTLTLRRFPALPPVYRFLMGISHPNLPAVYDAVRLSDGDAALIEYADGVTVAEVLQTGPYTYAGAKKVLLGVCAALDVLHKNGFVHRDIKPENIVVSDDGRVKLIDFDIARAFTGQGGDTRILGTLGYAPPEQQGLSETDPRSDIYALGVLLNVMLTLKHPSVSLAPGRAGKLVLACTAISPEKRVQTVTELAEKL